MAKITITTNASSGSGSFAQAIADATSGDEIVFSENVFTRGTEIEIATPETFVIDKDLTFDGGPFRVKLIPGSSFRIATVSGQAVVSFSGFDFTGGVAEGNGGGILVKEGAKLTLNRCRVCGCSATVGGGGIYVGSSATANINDSLICGNKATSGSGGGIFIGASATATFNGVTIAANTGGNVAGNATSKNSLIADDLTLYGFVSPPSSVPTSENWTWTDFQSWDFHLLDDGSYSPSEYRDVGNFDYKTLYDLDGNYRGRTANVDGSNIATCSPGCFETIQADFFWIGVDSTGAEVETPDCAAADGWAASRFATVSGSIVPQTTTDSDKTSFIGVDVDFSSFSTEVNGRCSFARTTVGGGRTVSFGRFLTGVLVVVGVGATLQGGRLQTVYYTNFRTDLCDYAYANLRINGDNSEAIGATTSKIKIYGPLTSHRFGGFIEKAVCYVAKGVGVCWDGTYRVGSLELRHYLETFDANLPIAPGSIFQVSGNIADFDNVPVKYDSAAPFFVELTGTDQSTTLLNSIMNVVFIGTGGSFSAGYGKIRGKFSTLNVRANATVKVDGDGLTLDNLTLNANAVLTLDDGEFDNKIVVRIGTSFTAKSNSFLIGENGVFLLEESASTTVDDSFSVNGVSPSRYSKETNAVEIAIYSESFESDSFTLTQNDDSIVIASGVFTGLNDYEIESFVSGENVVKTTSETLNAATSSDSFYLNATSSETTAIDKRFNSATSGYVYYVVRPAGTVSKMGIDLTFSDVDERIFRIYVGSGEEPSRTTLVYQGGNAGSFSNANDWSFEENDFTTLRKNCSSFLVDSNADYRIGFVSETDSPSIADFNCFDSTIYVPYGMENPVLGYEESELCLVDENVPDITIVKAAFFPGGTNVYVDLSNGNSVVVEFSNDGTNWNSDESLTTTSDKATFNSTGSRFYRAKYLARNVDNWSGTVESIEFIPEFKATSKNYGTVTVEWTSGYPDGEIAIERKKKSEQNWSVLTFGVLTSPYVDSNVDLNAIYSYRLTDGQTAIATTDDAYTSCYPIYETSLNIVTSKTQSLSKNLMSDTRSVSLNESVVFVAQIKNSYTEALLSVEDVESISCSVYQRTSKTIYKTEIKPVDEELWSDLSVPTIPSILEEPVVQSEKIWSKDAVGFNFTHALDVSENNPFSKAGTYYVVYKIDLVFGNPVYLTYTVNVY